MSKNKNLNEQTPKFNKFKNNHQPQNPPHYRNSVEFNHVNQILNQVNQPYNDHIKRQTSPATTLPKSPSQATLMSRHPSMPKINFNSKLNQTHINNKDLNKNMRQTLRTQVSDNNPNRTYRQTLMAQTNMSSTIEQYQFSHRQTLPIFKREQINKINKNVAYNNGLLYSQQTNMRPISSQINNVNYPTFVPNNQNKFNEYKKPVKLFSNKAEKAQYYRNNKSRSNDQDNIQPQLTANQKGQKDIEYTYIQRPQFVKTYNNDSQFYRTVGPQEDPIVKKDYCQILAYLLGIIGVLGLLAGIIFGLGIHKQLFPNNSNSNIVSNIDVQNGIDSHPPIKNGQIPSNPQKSEANKNIVPLQPSNTNIPIIFPVADNITYPTILKPTLTIETTQETNNNLIYPDDEATRPVTAPIIDLIVPINTQPLQSVPVQPVQLVQPMQPITNPNGITPLVQNPVLTTLITSQIIVTHPAILPETMQDNVNTVEPQTTRPQNISIPSVLVPTVVSASTTNSTIPAVQIASLAPITSSVIPVATVTPTPIPIPTPLIPIATVTPTPIIPITTVTSTATPTPIIPITTVTPTATPTPTPTPIIPITTVTPTATPTQIIPITTVTPTATQIQIIPITTVTPTATPTPLIPVKTVTPTPTPTIPIQTIPIVTPLQISTIPNGSSTPAIVPVTTSSENTVIRNDKGVTIPQNFKSKVNVSGKAQVSPNFKASKTNLVYQRVPQNFKAHLINNWGK